MHLSRISRAFWKSLKDDFMSRQTTAILARATPTAVHKAHPLSGDSTVILFGWAGARDAHVVKHSELYTSRGFPVLRFTSAFDGKHPLYLKDGRDIAGLFPAIDEALAVESRRILIHTYSMNGVFSLCALLFHPGYEGLLKRTDGIVMDSGPVYFANVDSYSRVLAAVLDDFTHKMGPLQKALAGFYRGYLTARMLQSHLNGKFLMKYRGVPKTELDAFHFLNTHPNMPPQQLYLFSAKDLICQSYMIREFIESQKLRGRSVDCVDFVDSEHVAHLRTHPELYEEALDRYLRSIAKTRGLI